MARFVFALLILAVFVFAQVSADNRRASDDSTRRERSEVRLSVVFMKAREGQCWN